MDARTEGIDTRAKAKPPVGRQDSEGQEAVIQHKVIKDREEELVELYNKAAEAASDLSEAIKKAAEDSGYNAGTVKKRIAAMQGNGTSSSPQVNMSDDRSILCGDELDAAIDAARKE